MPITATIQAVIEKAMNVRCDLTTPNMWTESSSSCMRLFTSNVDVVVYNHCDPNVCCYHMSVRVVDAFAHSRTSGAYSLPGIWHYEYRGAGRE